MITKLTHVSIYALDQASAYDFYTKQPGFKVITDAPSWFSLAQLEK